MRMTRLALVRAALAAALSISAAIASAQTPVLQRIVETGKIRVGMSGIRLR